MDLHWYDGFSDVRVFNANTLFTGHNPTFIYDARLTGSFTLRSTETGGRLMDVAVIEPLKLEGPYYDYCCQDHWRFNEGLLQLSAEDGSQLTFNAGTGNHFTVDIEIKDASDQATSLQDHSWDTSWLDQLDLVLENTRGL
jgi:hypothetical protein